MPLPFFLTAPVALLAAGSLLLAVGAVALRSGWTPVTLVLTHLGTLGFLSMVLWGVVYQIVPSVAVNVRGRRAGYAAHALLMVGLVFLAWGFLGGGRWAILATLSSLVPALLLFIVPMAWTLRRSSNEVGLALVVALGALLLTAFLGLWMAHGHGGMRFPGPRPLWVQAHLCTALLGWVGALLSAVSWHTLPATCPSRRGAYLVLGTLSVGVVLPVIVLGLESAGIFEGGGASPQQLAALGALPALVVVWSVQPLQSLRVLVARASAEPTTSERFWRTGFALAPLVGLVALVAYLSDDPRWSVLLGWLAIWGWAGMIAHGLLLAGSAGCRRAHTLHAVSLVLGVIAIFTGISWLARFTGLLLVVTALNLGSSLVPLLREQYALTTAGAGDCSSRRRRVR